MVHRVARYDVAMTSLKMTSLILNTYKDHVSIRHKFGLIVYKNSKIRIKIVEIMALFRVFLDHPSYYYVKFKNVKPHSHCADVATVHPDAGQPVYRDAPEHIS